MNSNLIFVTFIIGLVAAMAVSLFFIGYVWQRRSTPGAFWLIGVLAAIACWSLGYLIEYLNSSLEIKLFSWNISYIGIVTLPVMLILFASRYTRQDGWMTPTRIAALFIIPLTTILLQWTKGSHQLLYYDNMHLVTDGAFLLVAKQYGIWFWISASYTYITLITGIIILATRLFRPPKLLSDQVICIIAAALVPVIANVIYLFHLIPFIRADWTPCGFAITGVCLALLIGKHHFMDILPVARESAIELMQEGFLVIDNKQRMIDFNKSMLDIMNLTPQEAFGKPIPDEIKKSLYENQGHDITDAFKTEIALDKKERLHYYSVNVSPLQSQHANRDGFVLVFHDVTDRKLMEDAVKKIAFYDPLTGLPNRVLFYDRAEIAFSEAVRHQRQLAILMIDLDRFKDINDKYGHDAGDQVLQDISVRLSGAVRKIDTVSRIGGDEFVVLLPQIGSEATAKAVAQRIMDAAKRPFTHAGQEYTLTISIGIAIYPDDSNELESLIKCSDIAMYYIKQNGRNGYARYLPGMGEVASSIPPA